MLIKKTDHPISHSDLQKKIIIKKVEIIQTSACIKYFEYFTFQEFKQEMGLTKWVRC